VSLHQVDRAAQADAARQDGFGLGAGWIAALIAGEAEGELEVDG